MLQVSSTGPYLVEIVDDAPRLTAPLDQQSAAYYFDETTGLTTSIVRKQVPGGAISIELGLYPTTSSPTTARFLYVCFNAVSDSEEANMLATVGQRAVIPAGFSMKFTFDPKTPLTRYAMRTDAAAETNGSIAIQSIGSLL